ncbi:MAG: thioredoxin [Deltaproteobacteria bacterium]|nr:thioredoxin [Deltaproteobacteria bacterium]
MASANLIELNDDNFQAQVLQSDKPVLVDFWAVWCAPCRAIAPHVEALADKYVDQVRVGKFDIDANPAIAGQFDIRSIPTLLIFKGGKVVGQLVGAVPRPKIEAMVEKALGQ